MINGRSYFKSEGIIRREFFIGQLLIIKKKPIIER